VLRLDSASSCCFCVQLVPTPPGSTHPDWSKSSRIPFQAPWRRRGARSQLLLSKSYRGAAVLRRQLSIISFLIVAAFDASGAQAHARPDTTHISRDTLSGTWSATNGNATFMGTWTAVPDAARGTVIGTWTLVDPQGATLALGGWSAAKSPRAWTGRWRATIAGRDGEYSGTWRSTVDLESSARFVELFEKAAQTIVRGTWAGLGRSGAWSIRARGARS
jgi:hypothetical protein